MNDFAFDFPVRIFLEMMGLPQELMKQFLDWERNLIHNHDLGVITATTRNVVSYLREQIADRRANPRDDLITFGVRAQKQGEPLSEDELIGFMFNMFIGGLDTVAVNMGLQFLHLATHPEDQARLRARPEEIPAAIDEMMRGYGSISIFRTCKAAIEVSGVQIKPGDKVAMSATLGGRDPAEFPNPGEIRFDRKPQHFNFGYGRHACIGRALALREIRIAMEEFLVTIPTFRMVEGHVVHYYLGLIQPIELPLVW
jgi:cytochrome P450